MLLKYLDNNYNYILVKILLYYKSISKLFNDL